MARRGHDQYGQMGVPRMDSHSERELRNIRMISGRSPESRLVLKVIVWVLAISVTLFVVALATGNINNRKTANNLKVISEENYNPSFKVRYQELGEEVVTNWYTRGMQPVPMGADLQWPGETPTNIGGFGDQAPAKSSTSDSNSRDTPKIDDITFFSGERHDAKYKGDGTVEGYIESLTYLIVMNGKQYLSSITFNVLEDGSSPDANKPVLTSAPTLTPYIIFLSEPNKKVSNEPTGDLDEVKEKINENSETAINSFASAWTANDSVRLKQIVQDEDPDNIYYGLGSGWSYSSGQKVKINWTRTGIVGTERFTVMNISFNITSRGEAPVNKETGQPDESQRPTYTVTQSLDIVMDGYNSSLPAIKSWGPSGSWPTLDPYSNSVSAKDLKAPENMEQGTTETSEPSESPSASSSSSEKSKEEEKKEGK